MSKSNPEIGPNESSFASQEVVNLQIEGETNKTSAEISGNPKSFRGKIQNLIGSDKDAEKSLAFIALVSVFILLVVVILLISASYWCSPREEKHLSDLVQSVKTIIECFSPIITLILGYCLGEKINTKK